MPVVAALRRRGRACFVAAVVVAIAIESIGAFAYTGVTDVPIYAVASGPDKLRAAWDWRNAPFIASLSRGLAPAELMQVMRGTVDTIEVDGRATDTVVAGQHVVATGWALAGRATPLQVGITIDGRRDHRRPHLLRSPRRPRALPGAGAGRLAHPDRHRRPRARRAPAGRSSLGIREGRRLLPRTHADRLEPCDAGHRPQERLRSATPSFRTARGARIREHQQAPGYWLTAFTSATRFEQPRHEMNTYLTSLLVDLLDPLAAAGLGDSLQRARRHLTAQIEAGGLVRYHGLPDGPGIGTLGCAITPDTDDTALVWRIAPGPDRRRLSAALATIDAYRTSDGLYRTWLAPREAYQCLDPGSDPNPADVTIQMHLLQLLARSGRRPAARCAPRCAGTSTTTGSGSTTGSRRWSRCCARPISNAPAAAGAARVADADDGARPGDLGLGRPVAGARVAAGRSAARCRRRSAAVLHQLAERRLRADPTEPAAALPQRSQRDGAALLLVGRRRLRPLAAAGVGHPSQTAVSSGE